MRALIITSVMLLFVAPAMPVEIDGTVRDARGETATIVTESNLVPNVGDKIEIFFNMPGTDIEVSVGAGRVSEVAADSINAQIEQATGEIARDQLVRIFSDNPTQRGAPLVPQPVESTAGVSVTAPTAAQGTIEQLGDCAAVSASRGGSSEPYTCYCPPAADEEPLSVASDGSLFLFCHVARISRAIGPQGGNVTIYPQAAEGEPSSGGSGAVASTRGGAGVQSFRVMPAGR